MKRGRKLTDNLTVLKRNQFESFPHQVAGHFNEGSSLPLAFQPDSFSLVLRTYKDMILKPMNKMNLFLQELRLPLSSQCDRVSLSFTAFTRLGHSMVFNLLNFLTNFFPNTMGSSWWGCSLIQILSQRPSLVPLTV
jgi:hypothetical protein